MRLLLTLILSILVASPSHAGVLLQGFYWDAPSDWQNPWWDQLSRQSYDIAHSGFTAVWIPPVLKGASGGYSNGYDPYDDYDIGSKDQRDTFPTHWGTREQLLRSIAIMRANGLAVYVDTVLAHRNGGDSDGRFQYRDAFGTTPGGRFAKYPEHFWGWNDFGRQLRHDHDYVKRELIQAGDWLTSSLGTQGYRLDMTKYISGPFLREYLSQGAMNGKFAVSEYWSENIDELDKHVNGDLQGRLSAFDFPLWGRLKDMSNGNGFFDMRRLVRAGFIARFPDKSVTFVENHDTDRSYPITRNKHLAYAYILTSEGYPSVFWKDYYVYGMKSVIDPLIWIHEKLAAGPTEWRWSDDDLLIYERRGDSGVLVGLNDNQVYERKQWVQTGFGGFVTLHDYTGHRPDIRTEADGRVEMTVPANSYVAYAPSGMSWPHWVEAQKTTQQFVGASDLDISPALNSDYRTVGRVWVAGGSSIDWTLFQKPQAQNSGDMHILVFDPKNKLVAEQKTPLHWNSQNGSYKANMSGFYEFKIRIDTQNKTIDRLPYWLKITYQAPQKF